MENAIEGLTTIPFLLYNSGYFRRLFYGKKRRIEKTARVLLRIEYQNKIDDFLQNKLPLIENNELSPSVAKALLEVEMDEKIESLIKSGEAVNMVLTEIPTLVDNILESNINQLQLLESKTKITDEDISAIEDQSEREERIVSPEEIRKIENTKEKKKD